MIIRLNNQLTFNIFDEKFMKPTVAIVESFSLIGVDPVSVAEKYRNGSFKASNFPRIKVDIEDRKSVLKTSIDTSTFSDVYCYKDKSGNDVFIATSNCQQFRAHNTKQNSGDDFCGGRCFYCLRDFKTRPLGIVSQITYDHGTKHYHTEKIFDTFGCVFTYIRKMSWGDAIKDDFIMKTSQMFNDMYPGEPIPYANDMELLKSNQGSLSDEEWENKAHRYVQMTGRIVSPFKNMYIREKTGE